jgi:biotin synthesis protein BioG
MKAEWIVRRKDPDLLLFFNGWGMDRRLADHLVSACSERQAPGPDIVLLYDYRDLTLPEWLGEAIAGVRSVDLLAWSLGVWVAAHAGLDRVDRAVAVNGTCFPVDATRGIPPEIFKGTLEQWSDASRARFDRRMFARVSPERYQPLRSARLSGEQQEELRVIGEAVSAGQGTRRSIWRYSKAFVGGADLIFMPENQRRAWHEIGVPVIEIAEMPHFPFFHLDTLQELFR